MARHPILDKLESRYGSGWRAENDGTFLGHPMYDVSLYRMLDIIHARQKKQSQKQKEGKKMNSLYQAFQQSTDQFVEQKPTNKLLRLPPFDNYRGVVKAVYPNAENMSAMIVALSNSKFNEKVLPFRVTYGVDISVHVIMSFPKEYAGSVYQMKWHVIHRKASSDQFYPMSPEIKRLHASIDALGYKATNFVDICQALELLKDHLVGFNVKLSQGKYPQSDLYTVDQTMPMENKSLEVETEFESDDSEVDGMPF